MSGALSRTKGHSFERLIARDFQSLGFAEARRHLEYQDGEANGIDLVNTFPFAIQCKRGKKYASITAIEEIQDKDPDIIPVLITKGDTKETMAVLPWKVLMKMIPQYING